MENGKNPTTKTNEQPAGTTLQLVILWDQVTGAVQVTGPVQNKVICFGMLEGAKDAIIQLHAKVAAESRIVAPGGFPVVVTTREVS